VTTAAAVSPTTLASAACGGGSDTRQPPMTPSGRFATIGLESAGGPQVLYNGHRLYSFTGTAKPGDINGQRVTAFGAAWFAVSRAGQVVSRPGSKPGGGGIS